MNRHSLMQYICILSLIAALFLSGCSSGDGGSSHGGNTEGSRNTIETYLLPEASGETTYGSGGISIDASNVSEGYLMVRYEGGADKVKLQITSPSGTLFTYTLAPGSYETFPLSDGSGSYHLEVLEHAYDNMYALAFSQDVDVKLSDEFKPFLYPNQYVWYTADSEAVALALSLSKSSGSDLDYVEKVYQYVIENITYDTAKAQDIPLDYIPDIDQVLEDGKGICFDYASLMASMLRCQGIPTRLEVGYSGSAYHAWISVYLKEAGWVDKIIEFDGESWSLMDPTLAAGNNKDAVKDYIGDGSNYTVKYSY